jgi:hypothetical protein
LLLSSKLPKVLVLPKSGQSGADTIGKVQYCAKIQYQLKETQRVKKDCSKMGATSREKGISVMTRSVEDIVLSTEMATLDFEPSREEETFLQLIGLNRFITKVTWEILNEQVIQEVIANLNIDTMETRLNGKVIPIFGKEWRQRLKAVIYLQSFAAKREPGTPKVRAADTSRKHGKKNRNRFSIAVLLTIVLWGVAPNVKSCYTCNFH